MANDLILLFCTFVISDKDGPTNWFAYNVTNNMVNFGIRSTERPIFLYICEIENEKTAYNDGRLN
jgi:hypothetical protein